MDNGPPPHDSGTSTRRLAAVAPKAALWDNRRHKARERATGARDNHLLIDLHCHTWPLSTDSALAPDELIERAKEAGLDGICLTEHDYFWDREHAQRLAAKHDFLVLPGCEIGTEDGHMLVFGLHRYEHGMYHIRQLAQMVLAVEGAMVAAHPYRRAMPWPPDDEEEYHRAVERVKHREAYGHVTAVEVENGRGSKAENAFSRRVAEDLALPGTAGTDSHAIRDIARCATFFESTVESLDDLIAELRAGRFHPLTLERTTP